MNAIEQWLTNIANYYTVLSSGHMIQVEHMQPALFSVYTCPQTHWEVAQRNTTNRHTEMQYVTSLYCTVKNADTPYSHYY